MNKLKVGVIGTGHLGKIHTKLFKEIDTCELTGIFDSDEKQLKTVSDELDVPTFTSAKSLLDEVDAVSIAATTSAHYDIAKQCIEEGVHIFLEKPITATIDEGKKIVEQAKQKGITIQVGHIERFNPGLLSLEQFIDEPKFIQTDRLAQFNPRGTDVAVVLDLMIHDIDIILSLVNSEVESLDASGVAVVSGNIDIANARLKFKNGAVANVTASRISQKKMRKMRIFQKDTYLSLDFITGVSEVYRLQNPSEENGDGQISFGEIGVGDKKKRLIYEQPEVKEVNALKYELELFVKAVSEKTTPVVTGEDGLNALIVADQIIKKIEESKG